MNRKLLWLLTVLAQFVINLKAARQIGLTIPVRVLERANQVIK